MLEPVANKIYEEMDPFPNMIFIRSFLCKENVDVQNFDTDFDGFTGSREKVVQKISFS